MSLYPVAATEKVTWIPTGWEVAMDAGWVAMMGTAMTVNTALSLATFRDVNSSPTCTRPRHLAVTNYLNLK